MNWMEWLIAVLGILTDGWIAFDGLRAFMTGECTTTAKGQFAGQLGSQARIMCSIGLDPRSSVVKATFVTYGLLYLSSITAFLMGMSWGFHGRGYKGRYGSMVPTVRHADECYCYFIDLDGNGLTPYLASLG